MLAAGVVIMMTAGTAYSWSLYQRPLMAFYGWTSLETAMTFGVFLLFTGLGAIIGGNLHDHFGPHNVSIIGVALWGAGNLLCGIGIDAYGLWWLYLTYGVLAGAGCGIMYVAPSACVTRWFPDRRGLANGLMLLGFGLGSFFFNLALAGVPTFGHAAEAANIAIAARDSATVLGRGICPPALRGIDVHDITNVFTVSGIVFLIVGLFCASLLHSPPSDFVAPGPVPDRSRERDFTPGQMVHTPAFYCLWGIFFVDEFAAVAMLGNAVPIYSQLTGAGATTAAVVYGTLSLLNGLGRLAWAWVSDIVGRPLATTTCLFLAGASMAVLSRLHDHVAVGFAFAVFLFTFSGVFAIVPAMAADYFGTKYFGENYSFILTAATMAGFFSPVIVGTLEDATGSVTGALTPIACVLMLACVLPLVTKRPAADPRTPGVPARAPA